MTGLESLKCKLFVFIFVTSHYFLIRLFETKFWVSFYSLLHFGFCFLFSLERFQKCQFSCILYLARFAFSFSSLFARCVFSLLILLLYLRRLQMFGNFLENTRGCSWKLVLLPLINPFLEFRMLRTCLFQNPFVDTRWVPPSTPPPTSFP